MRYFIAFDFNNRFEDFFCYFSCFYLVIWQRQLLLLNNHVSPYENTSIRHLLFEWHLRHKRTFADGCHCENVYILWNRLDRTCYECIDYTIMYHMKHWSPDICLGFPQNFVSKLPWLSLINVVLLTEQY